MRSVMLSLLPLAVAALAPLNSAAQTSAGQFNVGFDPVVIDLRPQDNIPAQFQRRDIYARASASYGNASGVVNSDYDEGPFIPWGNVDASIVTPQALANGVATFVGDLIVEAAPWAGPPDATWARGTAEWSATSGDWASGGWLIGPHTQLVLSARYSFAAFFSQPCTTTCQQALGTVQMDWAGPLGNGTERATWFETPNVHPTPTQDPPTIGITLTNDTDEWQEMGWRALATLTYSWGPPPAPIPEPGTVTLMAAGLGLLMLRRRLLPQSR